MEVAMPYKDPETERIHKHIYYEANKPAIIAYQHVYNATHKEEKSLRAHDYHEEHGETIRAQKRAYHQAHREAILSRQKARHHAKKEEDRARKLAYAKAHPDIINVMSARHRARKVNAPINDLTAAQWREIKEHYGHRCVYCGRKMQRLSQDHITPLSKGGSHTASNVVPACQSCNSIKGVNAPFLPVQPLLLTNAPPRKKKIS
jgi:5-methylcytosine-specific restriction endonuclease McrA